MNTAALLEKTYRENASSLIGALMSVVRDLDFAEDVLQDAMIIALEKWPTEAPRNPAAWLLTTARRKAIDKIRHQRMSSGKEAAVALFQEQISEESSPDLVGGFGDERLRLVFTCCHPALSQEAQVALTMKAVCGLSTLDISNAFLINETTLAQRIVRAKSKIKLAGIPYAIPDLEKMSERMNAVLSVIYLVFNAGYHSSGESLLNVDLCSEAIRLSTTLETLIESQASRLVNHMSFLELQALTCLMKLNHARIRSRVSEVGDLVTLEEQNRSLWDHVAIEVESQKIGRLLTAGAASGGKASLGPYQLQASIAALHAIASCSKTTDWIQIVGLYNELYALIPTAVIRLNRAAAIAMAYSPEDGLREISEIEKAGELKNYSLLPAAKADLNRRLGNDEIAVSFYTEAIQLADGEKERAYYERRIGQLK